MDGEQQLGPPQRAFRKDLIAMSGAYTLCRGLADGFPRSLSAPLSVICREVRYELA